MSKLFILGWDNCLISDVTLHKVHPSYVQMWQTVDPPLGAKWTLADTLRMQGLPPEQVWNELALLLGKEKAEYGRRIFYDTYRQLPVPPLTLNAELLLKTLQECGCNVVVVSNKTQSLLEEEIDRLQLDKLVDIALGTTADSAVLFDPADPDQKLKSRCHLLEQAINTCPNTEEVIVIAGAGYAEPAYRIRVDRFEEASAPVFDWVAAQVKEEAERAMANGE